MSNIMLFIITWILTIVTFILGYIVGQKSIKNEPINIKFPKILKKKSTLGAIQNISQKELEKKGTRLEATEQAMTETLDKVL